MRLLGKRLIFVGRYKRFLFVHRIHFNVVPIQRLALEGFILIKRLTLVAGLVWLDRLVHRLLIFEAVHDIVSCFLLLDPARLVKAVLLSAAAILQLISLAAAAVQLLTIHIVAVRFPLVVLVGLLLLVVSIGVLGVEVFVAAVVVETIVSLLKLPLVLVAIVKASIFVVIAVQTVVESIAATLLLIFPPPIVTTKIIAKHITIIVELHIL